MKTKTDMPLLLAAWEERLAEGPALTKSGKPRRITEKEAEDLNEKRGILVSNEDLDTLGQLWTFDSLNPYPRCGLWIGGKVQRIFLHLVVTQRSIGPKPQEMDCDHINGIKSDCRRENLRYVSRVENQRNLHGYRGRRFIGAHKHANCSTWCAKISTGFKGGQIAWNGCRSEEEAAFRYNQLAQLFGFRTRNAVTPSAIW